MIDIIKYEILKINLNTISYYFIHIKGIFTRAGEEQHSYTRILIL